MLFYHIHFMGYTAFYILAKDMDCCNARLQKATTIKMNMQ